MTLAQGCYFLMHPVGPQRVCWAFGDRADRAELQESSQLATLRERLKGWHDPIAQVLSATAEDEVRELDVRAVPPLPSFVRGRIALLGDAAHAMSPDRGQGAAQAFEDALVLASVLGNHDNLGEALASYDELRRPRAQKVAREAIQLGQRMINTGPGSLAAMSSMMLLTPNWVWGWLTRPEGNRSWDWQPPELAKLR